MLGKSRVSFNLPGTAGKSFERRPRSLSIGLRAEMAKEGAVCHSKGFPGPVGYWATRQGSKAGRMAHSAFYAHKSTAPNHTTHRRKSCYSYC